MSNNFKGSKVGGIGPGARGWSVRELIAARDRKAASTARRAEKVNAEYLAYLGIIAEGSTTKHEG